MCPLQKGIRQQVIEAVEASPGKYMRVDLARMLDVSRERVRQIVDEEQLAKKVLKYRVLPVIFNCHECGRECKQQLSYFKKSKNHFCSRKCLDLFNGRYYGFGAKNKKGILK